MTLLLGVALGALIVIAALAIKASAWGFRAQSPDAYAAERPVFDAREALAGDYLCEGVLFDFTGRVRARFTASMHGRFDGEAGLLNEHFRYADGNEQRREWHISFREGGLTATADDIVGQAVGEQSGNTLRMRYRLRLPKSSGGLVVSVTDWLYLTETGVILNRSEMRAFGFKVAELFAVLKHRPADG